MRKIAAGFCLILLATYAHAQVINDVPKTGDKQADEQIIKLAQTGWRPEGAGLTYDGQTIYLSLLRAPRTVYDIYVCRKTQNRWGQPELIKELSSEYNDWSPTIASDEQAIYFIREDVINPGTKKEYKQTNLYASVRLPNGNWQTPQKMVVSSGKDTKPIIYSDNRLLCYTSLRDATDKKAQPIRYYIKKLDKYNWTLPTPVPEATAESALRGPVLCVEGDTKDAKTGKPVAAHVRVIDALTRQQLSQHATDENGHFLLALPAAHRYQLDLYKQNYSHEYLSLDLSDMQADSLLNWQGTLSPELHLVLHTYDVETQTELHPDVRVADMASKVILRTEKSADGHGEVLHLPIGREYSVALHRNAYADTTLILNTSRDVCFPRAEIEGYMRIGKAPIRLSVIDSETKRLLPAEVLLSEVNAEDSAGLMSLPQGEIDTLLRYGMPYNMSIRAAGYMFKDTTMVAPQTADLTHWTIALQELRAALVVQLRNIQFEFNSHLLIPASYTELQLVADLMRQNPTLKIEISAHTDDVGSEAYNLKLSNRRAASAMNYLVEEEGISPDRLTSVGYGKDKPLVPNDSDENRAINRRVEFKITDL